MGENIFNRIIFYNMNLNISGWFSVIFSLSENYFIEVNFYFSGNQSYCPIIKCMKY